jgi:hypothetical protein
VALVKRKLAAAERLAGAFHEGTLDVGDGDDAPGGEHGGAPHGRLMRFYEE